MSKCDKCPALGACRAEHPEWGFLCATAERGYACDLAMIRGYSPIPLPPPAPVVPLGDLEQGVGASPDVAVTYALLVRARDCPYKEALGCGCRYGACTRLDREVSPSDCIQCLTNGDDKK